MSNETVYLYYPRDKEKLESFVSTLMGSKDFKVCFNIWIVKFYIPTNYQDVGIRYEALYGVKAPDIRDSNSEPLTNDFIVNRMWKVAEYWHDRQNTALKELVEKFDGISFVHGFSCEEALKLARVAPENIADWYPHHDQTPNAGACEPGQIANTIQYKLMPDGKTFVFDWGDGEVETYITVQELEAICSLLRERD